MSHDWIVEVLDDLKSYSDRNRLPVLARRFEEMRLVALSEIGTADRTALDSVVSGRRHDGCADQDEVPLFAPSQRLTPSERKASRASTGRRHE